MPARVRTNLASAMLQRSVACQVEQARAYPSRKGWHVVDEHVYVDDGISGAEFANRLGFLRLMNARKPRPPHRRCKLSQTNSEQRRRRNSAADSSALPPLAVGDWILSPDSCSLASPDAESAAGDWPRSAAARP